MLNSKLFWISLLAAWIAASAYWHVCKILNLCDVDLVTSYNTVEDTIVFQAEPLIISDTPELKLKSKGNFYFAKGGIISNKAEVYPEIDSLALYLKANPEKLLTITGYYSPRENNTTTFSNLGIARASEIKNWFLGKGISNSVFVLKGQLKNNMIFTNDSLSGGIQFNIDDKFAPPKEGALSEIELANNQIFTSIFKPLDLYFLPDNADYIKNDQNLKFIVEAKKYLANNGDKKLILTGYKNTKDSTKWDLSVSKKHADFLRKRLIALGLPENNIVIQKGTLLNNNSKESCADCKITVIVR